MIFKKLFTPAHAHSDPTKRRQAINKLNPDNEQDKRILHELAFNDSDNDVTLAALERIASFSLWFKISETHHSQKVRQSASEHVQACLLDEALLSQSEFNTFIRECSNKPLLEQILFNNSRLQRDESLCLLVLSKLDKEQTTRRFYEHNPSTSIRRTIVVQTQSEKQLNRFLKQTQDAELAFEIEKKLADLLEAREKPKAIEREAKLINSKLLALKDNNDYPSLKSQFDDLTKQFSQLAPNLSLLNEEDAAEISEKFLTIKARLSQHIEQCKQQHDSHAALRETSDLLADLRKRNDIISTQVTHMLVNADIEFDSQIKLFKQSLSDASDELLLIKKRPQTAAHKQIIKTIESEQANLIKTLDGYPSYAQTVIKLRDLLLSTQDYANKLESSVASNRVNKSNYKDQDAGEVLNIDKPTGGEGKPNTDVIDNINDTTLTTSTDDVRSHLASIQSKFKQVLVQVRTLDFKSDALVVLETDTKAALKRIRQSLEMLQEDELKAERKCLGKLNVIKRLISDGKFKAAISTFYALEELLKTVKAPFSPRLSKSYTQVSDEIDKLKGLQSFIAEPRKKVLLEEAQSLASQVPEDIHERVKKVKTLRSEWSSLGKLHTDEDTELNQKFDDVIESAFAPCRAFYAQLDKRREENHNKLKVLLEEVSDLDEVEDLNLLNKELSRLKKAFYAIDEVDKDTYKKLRKRFNQAINPLQQRIIAHYDENAEQKRRLIVQINNLKGSENLKEATEVAKNLQGAWKKIGFAGKKFESELWASFRQSNDELFNAYHQAENADKEATVAKLNVVREKLKDLTSIAQNCDSFSQLKECMGQLKSLETSEKEIIKANKSLVHDIDKIYKILSETKLSLDTDRKHEELKMLFDYLVESVELEDSLPPSELPNRYKQALNGKVSSNTCLNDLSRVDLIIAMAIVSNNNVHIAGIKNFEARQKQIQLQLMTAKLQANISVDNDDILSHWLARGPLSSDDLALLPELKKLLEASS